MKLKSLGALLVLAWVASACGEEKDLGAGMAPSAVRETQQGARSTTKVLIQKPCSAGLPKATTTRPNSRAPAGSGAAVAAAISDADD